MDATLDTFWSSLRRRLADVLAEQVPRGSKVAYLEFPNHSNIGDLMIFLGTEHWLRHSGAYVLGRWHQDNFTFPKFPKDAVLLCQGGGNMGDLYPWKQAFREAVVKAYPSNAILFLPQTIHYKDPTGLDASAKILNGHSNLTILLRDSRSLTIAQTHFTCCQTALAPDMTMLLHPFAKTLKLGPAASSPSDTLYLLREDIERCERQKVPELGPGWTGDWRALLRVRKVRLNVAKRVAHYSQTVGANQLHAAAWHIAARGWVRACASRFLKAKAVVTSRLHGHILASLLGVENILLDNTYGKNGAYYQTWHRELPIARFQSDDACEET